MMNFYRLRLKDADPPDYPFFWVEEGHAVKAAKALAEATKQPVTIEVDYDDGDGWQVLRIEGREWL